MAEQQHQQSLQQTVKVAVRRNGRQEQQQLFLAPVSSSFALKVLEEDYGPGRLRLEVNDAVVPPTTLALQPSERYVYDVSAGVCGPSLALGRCVSVLQTPLQPTVHRQPCAAA